MSTGLPSQASAVIIGGGVIGASVAYHLAKQGWQDVILLERKQFSCGTTWHAAGLIGTMRANESHARLCEYSMSLLDELEQETGQSTGFRQVGSLTVAHSADRLEELKRVAAMNNAFGVTRVDIITPEEAKALYPMLHTDDLLGASWVAQDGTASPIDTQDIGRNSLVEIRQRIATIIWVQLRMTVRIDESRRNPFAGRVNSVGRRNTRAACIADKYDALAADSHIRDSRLRTRAVENQSADQQHIDTLTGRLRRVPHRRATHQHDQQPPAGVGPP